MVLPKHIEKVLFLRGREEPGERRVGIQSGICGRYVPSSHGVRTWNTATIEGLVCDVDLYGLAWVSLLEGHSKVGMHAANKEELRRGPKPLLLGMLGSAHEDALDVSRCFPWLAPCVELWARP